MESYHIYLLTLTSSKIAKNLRQKKNGVEKYHKTPLFRHFFTTISVVIYRGPCATTPFETLHQFLIGMMPYILESLYNYRSVTDVWKQFFNKRACPDVPQQETNEQNETSKENLQ